MVIAASSGASAALSVFLVIAGFAAYWVPTVVAVIRHVPSTGSIIVINLFAGWTLIGWVAALAMAVRSLPARPPVPAPPPPLRPEFKSSAYDKRNLPPPPGGYR